MVLPADEVLIVPKKGRSEQTLPLRALLVFAPQDVRSLLDNGLENAQTARKQFLSDVHEGEFRGVGIALAGPMLGAPQAVLVLEKLIALGVRSVVAFGWCGALQRNVEIGDVILPEWAVSEEGTSGHYPIAESRPGPDPGLHQRLTLELARSGGFTIHGGGVWSTDAPYRETVAKVMHYQDAGLAGVEMEASALFTVACYRQIRLAVVLAVSDDLSHLRWRHGFGDKRFKRARRRLIEPILKALVLSDDGGHPS